MPRSLRSLVIPPLDVGEKIPQTSPQMYDQSHLDEVIQKAFEDDLNYNVPKGITRYDYDNQHGWWVRVNRDKTPFNKFFRDNEFGSIDSALVEAIKYRHEIISSFPVTAMIRCGKSLPNDPEKRVTFHEAKGYFSWRAVWYDEQHERIVQLYPFITLGGEEKAKELALEDAKTKHNYTPKLIKVHDPYLEEKYTPHLREEVEIWASISVDRKRRGGRNQFSIDPFVFEGKDKLVLHRSFERHPEFRKLKLKEFIQEHGFLHCEVCHFSFFDTYRFLMKDIIEVHHIVPLSKIHGETKIYLSDLILLCANCHLAVHQGDEEQNLKSMKKTFKKKNKTPTKRL